MVRIWMKNSWEKQRISALHCVQCSILLLHTCTDNRKKPVLLGRDRVSVYRWRPETNATPYTVLYTGGDDNKVVCIYSLWYIHLQKSGDRGPTWTGVSLVLLTCTSEVVCMSLLTIQSAMSQMHCKCGMFCNFLISCIIFLYLKNIITDNKM